MTTEEWQMVLASERVVSTFPEPGTILVIEQGKLPIKPWKVFGREEDLKRMDDPQGRAMLAINRFNKDLLLGAPAYVPKPLGD